MTYRRPSHERSSGPIPRWSLMLPAITWVSGTIWEWSWYTMFLEVLRWGHVTRSLRFNHPGPPIPGTNIRPKAGLPLRLLYASCAGAPLIFIASVKAQRTQSAAANGVPRM